MGGRTLGAAVPFGVRMSVGLKSTLVLFCVLWCNVVKTVLTARSCVSLTL